MNLSVLMITSEWPSTNHPEWAPFLVQQVHYLREAGIEVDVFNFRGNKNPLNYLNAWFRLRRIYQLSQYDLIHAQYGQSGLIAFPSPVPLVVTFHGSDLQGIVGNNGRYSLRGRILQQISRSISKKANKVILVSERLRQWLPAAVHTEIIPGGIDFSLFFPRSLEESRLALGLSLEKLFVLFPARPDDPVKRYNMAKTVVESLQMQFDVEMIVLQNIPHEKVPLYLNACDVLLLTSFHEGSPTVVKEALACNLPVVSVDVGDVRERLKGIAGCFVCPDDSLESLLKAMENILRMRKRIDGQEAIKSLDERIIVQKIISVYEQAVRSLK